MARRPRLAPGGIAFHAMNRGAGRMAVFDDAPDYLAFEKVLAEARERVGMRVCAYCLMPNHFHLVLWPRRDGDLSAFMKWLTLTHSQRWHAHRHNVGDGAVYQGRFRSFPVREDEHFLKVCRYVERNALRARLVRRAANWPWCSLHKRERAPAEAADLLDEWPVARPADWAARVDEPQGEAELASLRLSVRRGRPFGPDPWAARVAARLGLEATLRPIGRPPKGPATATGDDMVEGGKGDTR